MKKITNEEFIERSKKIWGNKYNYSLVNYHNMKKKIDLICENNHIFSITPDNHLRLKNCPYCLNRVNLVNNIDKFIEKSNEIHKNKYDYSLVKYTKNVNKVKIICSSHGIFNQTPNSHLSGSGCRLCYIDSLKMDIDKFIEKSNEIHKNKYYYSLVEYTKNINKVKIICPVHGVFNQSPSVHLSGSGCKKCMIDNLSIGFLEFKRRSIEIHGDKYKYDSKSYLNLKKK
jgi:hypothetical protein